MNNLLFPIQKKKKKIFKRIPWWLGRIICTHCTEVISRREMSRTWEWGVGAFSRLEIPNVPAVGRGF